MEDPSHRILYVKASSPGLGITEVPDQYCRERSESEVNVMLLYFPNEIKSYSTFPLTRMNLSPSTLLPPVLFDGADHTGSGTFKVGLWPSVSVVTAATQGQASMVHGGRGSSPPPSRLRILSQCLGQGWGAGRRAPVFQDHHVAIPLCTSVIATTSTRVSGASFPLTHSSAVTCNGKLFTWSAFRSTFNPGLLTFPPNLSSPPNPKVPESPLSSYVLYPCLQVTRVRTSKQHCWNLSACHLPGTDDPGI